MLTSRLVLIGAHAPHMAHDAHRIVEERPIGAGLTAWTVEVGDPLVWAHAYYRAGYQCYAEAPNCSQGNYVIALGMRIDVTIECWSTGWRCYATCDELEQRLDCDAANSRAVAKPSMAAALAAALTPIVLNIHNLAELEALERRAKELGYDG